MSGWYLTTSEAAKLVGCSATLIRNCANDGRLAVTRNGHRMFFALEDVQRMRQERRRLDAMLSCEDVGRIIGSTPEFVAREIKRGKLRFAAIAANNGYRIERADLDDYWREYMDCVCVRCGILGEATAARMYRCAACEYEERTGRIYRWPGASCLKAVRRGAPLFEGMGL